MSDDRADELLYGEQQATSAERPGETPSAAIEMPVLDGALPTDPSLTPGSAMYQWYLTGTWGLHTNLVWQDYTGAGIKLADFDDGFDYTNPDLAANYSQSLDHDYADNDSDAAPVIGGTDGDNHGTAVMGVMIADNNGSGTVGVAYDATGVGIREDFENGTLFETLEAFQYALSVGADVMNNSWGYSAPFYDDFSQTSSGTDFGDLATAIKNLADQGRGGLGTSVVFAAGNSRTEGDNVNYHNFQNSPYVITVAAIDVNGKVADFSNPGSALLVSAGGVGDYTTDRVGSAGYATGNYVSVDGTSFAAPTVSGLIALMLQANPNLGWRDVQEILAYSAQHNDPNSSGWHYNGAVNWNGGGMHFSEDYGFGAADAFGAVRLAESWNVTQDSTNMVTYTTATTSPHSSIQDFGTATSTIAVTQNINIEHVLVHLNIAHNFPGDLVITLTSPDGTVSTFVNRPGEGSIGDYGSYQGEENIVFETETNATWGESSVGDWTLKVYDADTGTTGTLNSWNMTFTGSSGADETYVFNDEFAKFSGAALAARDSISDTDGGTDMLNLSMVTSNSTVSLGAHTGTIGGHAVSITGIENIYGGDGNDSLTGDSGVNLIYGGRGNDVLDGGAGVDTMTGGAGDDTYYADSGSDSLVELANGGTDTINAAFTVNLASYANFENVTLGGTGDFNATGTSGDNTLTGNSGTNTLTGGAGNDTYYVDSAADVVIEASGAGMDTVYAGFSLSLASYANVENATLTGSSAANLTGSSVANTLTGNSGDNTLDGGAGVDRLVGGSGNDSYVLDSTSDVVVEATGGGNDTIFTGFSASLANLASYANIENITLTGTGNFTATGNTGDNTLTGNSGTNTLMGGTGNDAYVVDSLNDVVLENAGGGADTVYASISLNLASYANVENLALTGSSSANLTGNTGVNTLTGNSGDNTLDGGAGVDTLIGGLGNDTYIVDVVGDKLIEAADAGTDTVSTGLTYTLLTNFENLVLTGTANVNGTGNSADNTLTGNSGNNTLNGGLGADVMDGGDGNDLYMVDNSGDVIVNSAGADIVQASVSYALAEGVQNVTFILAGTTAINGTGNSGDNIITGNTAVNILTGNGGNDTLDGGAGADTMIGGTGDDIYRIDNAGDVVTELTGEGNDTIITAFAVNLTNTYANVENATLTGTAGLGMVGNDAVNILVGNSGNNTIDGGIGADTMNGGAGNDTYIVDNASDVIIDSVGTADVVKASSSYTLGDGLEQLIITGTGGFTGKGNAAANVITVNDAGGNSTLDGGAGADTLSGGLGDDTYIIDVAGDKMTEAVNGGVDTVEAGFSYTLLANFENLTLTGTGNFFAKGNTVANVLTGNEGNNTLDGLTGADTMAGGQGNDTYYIDNAGDIVIENASEGNDTIISAFALNLATQAPNIENFTLTGTAAGNITGSAVVNILTGNGGANTIDGGAGADTMIGGAGNDTYIVDNSGDVITDSAGVDIVKSSVSYTLSTGLEQLIITATGDVVATGNAGANVITVNDSGGNSTLDGGAGADTLSGGLGDDTYVIDVATDKLIEAPAGGIDTVRSAITYTLLTNFENLTLTGTANINAKGNADNNIIFGNSGNNTLDGLAGADTMHGGFGNDIYYIDNIGDSVVENAGEGTDTVFSPFAIDLNVFANVENATLTGTGAFNLTGNASTNILTGNAAINTIDGGAGADTMIGGAGNDTYVVDDSHDVVTDASGATDIVQASASFVLATGIEQLFLTGSGDINGTGNTANNYLEGNSGNNTLDGGTGNDTMAGGLGDDTYVVGATLDVVTEAAGAGSDTVISSITYTLGANLENLTLSGTAALNATGNTLDNTLTGNNGANTLDGGSGADHMIGGLGADTYIVDNIGDIVIETSTLATEHDTVKSSLSYTLGANLENLILTGSTGHTGIGNELVNTLTGTSGNDTLNGMAGADHMNGGLGNDTYYVDNVKDVVTEVAGATSGIDTVHSSVDWTLGSYLENLVMETGAVKGTGNTLNNVMTGNEGDNTLNGMTGNDTLDGGLGHDILTGGAGVDTFLFSAAGYDGQSDTITDFTATGTSADKLDISDILTGYTGGTLHDFVEFVTIGTDTQVMVDRDGSGTTYGFTQVALLTHVVLTASADDLMNTGHLIVT